MTTIAGKQPTARSVPTSVTRAAGINLTKALANEYAADNILVNTICLGRLKSAQWTRRWQAHFSHMTLDEFYAKQGESIPLQRLGEAEDVADLVCFLASERARYITGTAINIDGGSRERCNTIVREQGPQRETSCLEHQDSPHTAR